MRHYSNAAQGRGTGLTFEYKETVDVVPSWVTFDEVTPEHLRIDWPTKEKAFTASGSAGMKSVRVDYFITYIDGRTITATGIDDLSHKLALSEGTARDVAKHAHKWPRYGIASIVTDKKEVRPEGRPKERYRVTAPDGTVHEVDGKADAVMLLGLPASYQNYGCEKLGIVKIGGKK
jgi:hypothetical protein